MSRLTLALAFSLAACAAPSSPEASGEAAPRAPLTGTYTHDHEVGVFDGANFVPSPATDRLVVVENGGDLRVAFSLVRGNAHLCGWSGALAPEASGGWVSREVLDDLDDAPTCTLRLEAAADTLTLRDDGDVCRRAYCGARGWIDGSAFARATWSPDTTTADVR